MADLEGDTYTAEINYYGDCEESKCGFCDWSGQTDALDPIEDCALSPGDKSPSGRCPECGSLAYLDNFKTRAQDAAEKLFDMVRGFVTGKTIIKGEEVAIDFAALKADAEKLMKEIQS